MNKLVLAAAVAVLTFSACDKPNYEKSENSENSQNNSEISTDLVNNPATAAEGVVVDEANAPSFEFEETVLNFGTISQGEKAKQTFKFKNVGKTDLIISDAKGSCGCTVPVWPRNPIAPGDEAEIEVVFDSNGKSGHQKKTVTLVANTVPNTMVLAIEGDILVPESANTTTVQ